MELLNQEETLYKISDSEERTFKEIINYKFTNSLTELNPLWINRNFKDFDNTPLKEVAGKLSSWDFISPIISSILSVQNGIGKSHLATCIYKKYVYDLIIESFTRLTASEDYLGCPDELRKWVNDKWKNQCYKKYEFLSEKKLALIIQDSFNNKSSSQYDILENYCKLDFLVIDDCFSMKQNEFARQNIFYIIDERAEWNNKPTFITSNLSIKEIADIDTRIADRIRNSMMFQITDKMESFRKKL